MLINIEGYETTPNYYTLHKNPTIYITYILKCIRFYPFSLNGSLQKGLFYTFAHYFKFNSQWGKFIRKTTTLWN